MGVVVGSLQGKHLQLQLKKQKLLIIICTITISSALDLGSGGVYDSPSATDVYVRQFGFMFGGGRSGLHGLTAIKKSQHKYHFLHLPSLPRNYKEISVNTKVSELDPLKVEVTGSQPQTFHRFSAVP